MPLLVLDSHYLCHRAFHSAKHLSWGGKPTGVIFGFLQSISFLKDEFQTDDIAFCFEHPHLFRRDVYPDYKLRRRLQAFSKEELKSYQALSTQIKALREDYLPRIGFKNVFCFKGMESDDIMAAIALSAPDYQDVVLITSDADMYQCLRSNVSMYSPTTRKLLTHDWFRKTHGIPPHLWAKVKAMAGCHGDGVPGIKGVGEKTAVRYLREGLDGSSKAFLAIVSREGKRQVEFNRQLVKLPYQGCPVPKIRKDEVSKRAWIEVCASLGMRSIATRLPIATRKLGRHA